MTETSEKEFEAIISLDPDKPGLRVRITAGSMKEAREKLEAKYGKGSVHYLYNEEVANRLR